jgi:4-amino-4-deoxy-L-arabinose transferase-like glycosyltransferase
MDGFWSHKYPAFHFMVLSTVYAPFFAYLVVSGQFSLAHISETWPYGLSDPIFALTTFTLIARLLSAAMGTTIVALIYLITRRLFDGAAALFAALIVALSFPFIYYSHTSNVDIPYLFWFALGFFFYSKLLGQSRSRDYVFFGMSMALSVATKDQAYALLPFLPLVLLWCRVQEQREGGPSSRQIKECVTSLPWHQFGLAGVAFVGTYVVAANVMNNWQGYLQHVQLITGPASAPAQQFHPTLAGHIELLSSTISQLAWSLNIPLFVVCTVGLLLGLVRFRKVTLALLAPVLSYYLFFVAVILYVYPRFVLPFVLVFAIFGGHLLRDLWYVPGRLSWVTRSVVALLLLYSFLYGASVNWLLQEDPRYQAENWLARNIPQTTILEAYGPAQYLPRFSGGLSVRRFPLRGYVEEEFRQRRPEYVFLTWAFYKRIADDRHDDFDPEEFDQEAFLKHLMNGELGYRIVADFHAPEFIASNLIPGINSRIIILARRSTAVAVPSGPQPSLSDG